MLHGFLLTLQSKLRIPLSGFSASLCSCLLPFRFDACFFCFFETGNARVDRVQLFNIVGRAERDRFLCFL